PAARAAPLEHGACSVRPDLVEPFAHRSMQGWDDLVQIAAPEIRAPEGALAERQARLARVLQRLGAPPSVAEELEHGGLVADGVTLPISVSDERAGVVPLAPIEGEERRQTQRQAFRQAVGLTNAIEQRPQNASSVFADGVEGDAQELVPDERIFEPLQHDPSKLRPLSLWQPERRQDLLVDRLAVEAAEQRVGHALPDGVMAGQVPEHRGQRVGAVLDAHLAFAIRFDVLGEDRVHPRPPQRQRLLQIRRRLNRPEVEGLRGDEQRIFMAELLPQLWRFQPGVAGDDAVDEGVVERTRLAEPAEEGARELPS